MSHSISRSLLVLLVGICVSWTAIGVASVSAQDVSDREGATRGSDTGESRTGAADPDEDVTVLPNEEPEEVPGNNVVETEQVTPADKKALQRRAGERIGNTARGRAVVLGMHIQEGRDGRAKVVDVAPASPAFDAGIRKGDEIVSFDGFKATSYRDWVDGMARLTRDTPDGDTIPIALVRDDKRLNLRLRAPVAKAGVVPEMDDVALNQNLPPGQLPGEPGAIVPGQQPAGLPYGGLSNANTLFGDTFGDEFAGESADAAGLAVAELFRINSPQMQGVSEGMDRGVADLPGTGANSARGRNSRGASPGGLQGGSTTGARVGLAGLRNDANGMMVMIDVGGLEPGNYRVAIGDPSVMNAGNVGGAGGNLPGAVPRNPRARTGNVERGGTTTPGRAAQDAGSNIGIEPYGGSQPAAAPSGNAAPATRGAAPASGRASGGGDSPAGGTGGGNPQGNLNRPSNGLLEIPRTVLAQVTDTGAPASGAGSSNIPATGQVNPVNTPATGGPATPQTPPTGQAVPTQIPPTGEVNPVRTPPTGEVVPNNSEAAALRPLGNTGRGTRNGSNGHGIGGAGMPVGTLTIDQSGTGRLSQVVEAVRVQDVVGQAIVIYSQNGSGQPGLPPNLDATVDPQAGRGQQGVGQATANVGQATGTSGATGATNDASPAAANNSGSGLANSPAQPAAAQNTAASRLMRSGNVVAAGVIRMMNGGAGVAGNTGDPAAIPGAANPDGSQAIPQSSGVPAEGPQQLR